MLNEFTTPDGSKTIAVSSVNPLPVTAGGTGTGAGQSQGTAANGSATLGNPNLVSGADSGGITRTLLTDTSGRVVTVPVKPVTVSANFTASSATGYAQGIVIGPAGSGIITLSGLTPNATYCVADVRIRAAVTGNTSPPSLVCLLSGAALTGPYTSGAAPTFSGADAALLNARFMNLNSSSGTVASAAVWDIAAGSTPDSNSVVVVASGTGTISAVFWGGSGGVTVTGLGTVYVQLDLIPTN